MEDYYYNPTSLKTVEDLETGFPGVHSTSRHQSSSSPRPRRASPNQEMEDYYYNPTSLKTVEDLETGFPGVHSTSRHQSSSSPRPRRAYRDDAGELRHHYLDACFRCGRVLAGNKDIFMYRGDTPFCSEECRQQQIETDEAREKRSKQPAAAAGREQQRQRQSPQRVSVWAR